MDMYVSLVQTHAGRDKIMRTTGYAASLLSAAAGEKNSAKLLVIAKQISAARTVLRLFDDYPMWTTTRQFGASEKDLLSRIFTIASNVSIQLFFPIEHFAWANDHKIVSSSYDKISGFSTACWAISLFFNILKSIRKIYLLKQEREDLIQRIRLERPDKTSESHQSLSDAIHIVTDQTMDEKLNLVKNIADFLLAINVLPWKFLWSGKFSSNKNAGFGMVSSVVGLYMLIKAQRKTKKA